MRLPDRIPRARMLALLVPAVLGACWTGGVKLPDTGYLYEWEMDPDQGPIPYGFWGLNGFHHPEGLAEVQDRFGITAFHTSTYSPSYGVGMLLPMVREAGLRVNLRMAGNHTYYTTADGDFDLGAWKEMLAPWNGSGVQEFIDDGTIAYHMLLDDIANFEGDAPTAEELDEMARFSKALLPGLAVAVREEAARLPDPVAGRYEHLDASMNQYVASYGDVEQYALVNIEAADELGIDIINGLNMADGGDGRSGQPGWSENKWAMSADEIVEYGYVLSAVPGCRMFLAWEYDAEEPWSDGSLGSDYFDRPENTEALRWLGQRLAGEAVDRP